MIILRCFFFILFFLSFHESVCCVALSETLCWSYSSNKVPEIRALDKRVYSVIIKDNFCCDPLSEPFQWDDSDEGITTYSFNEE